MSVSRGKSNSVKAVTKTQAGMKVPVYSGFSSNQKSDKDAEKQFKTSYDILSSILKSYNISKTEDFNNLGEKFKDLFLKDIKKFLKEQGITDIDINSIITQLTKSKTLNLNKQDIKQLLLNAIKNISGIELTKSQVEKIVPDVKLNKNQVKNIINDLINDKTNADLNNLKSSIIKNNRQLITKTVKKFKTNLINKLIPQIDSSLNSSKIERGTKQTTNVIAPFLNIELSYFTKRKGTKLANDLIKKWRYAVYYRAIIKVTDFMNGIFALPEKILKRVSKLVRDLVGWVPRVIFKTANLIVGSIIKIITKPIELVFKLAKSITSNLFKFIKNSNIYKIFLTPTGMYTLGFVLGFIWKKVMNFIDKKKKDIKTINIFEEFQDIVGKIDTFLNKYFFPIYNLFFNLWKIGKWAFEILSDPFKEIFDVWIKRVKEDGLVEGTVDTFVDVKRKIEDMWWFKLLKNITTFIANNPRTSFVIGTLLYSLSDLFLSYRKVKTLFKISGQALKLGGGNLFIGMMSMAAGTLSYMIGSTIFEEIFKTNTKHSLEFITQNLEDFSNSRELFDTNKIYSQNEEDREKAARLDNLILSEFSDIRFYKGQLELLEKLHLDNVDLLNSPDSSALATIDGILNTRLFSKDEIGKIYNSLTNKNGKEQLDILSKFLLDRSNRLTQIQDTLNATDFNGYMKKVDEIFDGDRIKTNIFNNSNVLYHKHVSYLTLAGLGVQWQSYDNNEKLYDGIVTEREKRELREESGWFNTTDTRNLGKIQQVRETFLMGEAKKTNSLFYKLLKNKGIKDVDKQERFIKDMVFRLGHDPKMKQLIEAIESGKSIEDISETWEGINQFLNEFEKQHRDPIDDIIETMQKDIITINKDIKNIKDDKEKKIGTVIRKYNTDNSTVESYINKIKNN